MATGLVAGLALALSAPSAAFALSAGCTAINSMGGTFTVDASGNGTDKFTDRVTQPLANGETVNYSWSGNTKGAYVYVLYTQGGSSQYAPQSVLDSSATSGSGSFTFNSTTNNASVGDYFQVGLQDTDYFTTATPKPSARSSSVNITLSCTGPAPTVTSISPTAGPTAGGTSVVVTGTNFSGVSGATGVTFGGANAVSYTVNSSTQITAVAPAGSAGTVDVRVTNAGVTSATSAADQFTYVAAPTVTSLSPTSGPTAGGTTVVITGTGFSAANPTGAVKFGAVSATYTVNSNTQITATSPVNSAGTYDVTVTTPGGTSATSAADQYTYVAAPTVTSVSPTAGPTAGGTSVVITGTGFAAANPTGAVKFGATNAIYTVNSNTQITATSPANSAGTYDVTVATPGGTSAISAADQYTYIAAPTVTAVSPTAGPTGGGTTVTITGTGFAAATPTGAVKFGATVATYTINSNTQITATSPANSAGTYDVTVATPGGTSATSAADQFTYVGAPTVTSVSPQAGPTGGGTTVTITGTGFAAANPTGAVKFGAANATYTINSNTQITATSPANSAGTYDITVATAGGTSATSAADQYTYVAAPTVTGVSPTSGPTAGGTTVTITGTGFAAANPTGAVKFGATSATYTINSNTQITATSPVNSAGTYDITVATAGGTSATSAADQFTYVAAPTVTGVTPPVGPQAGGVTVTLTGTNFSGANAVTFGGVAASGYTVVSGTQITATAPSGTGTVDIRVTTSGGTSATSAADQFTYVPTPVLSGVSPNTGPTFGGDTVVITGSGLTMTGMVTFGGTTASFTVNSDTQITATTPTHLAGAVDVAVVSPGGSGTYVGGFTYFVPQVSLPVSVASGTVGQAYSGSVAAPHANSYNVTSGSLSPGLTLNSSTGEITGTPSGAGNWNFVVTAGGETGWTGSAQAYTLSIAAPTLTLAPASLANGTVGVAYSATVTASGGTAPYGYEVTAGTLPTGLTLSATTGALTGTPIAGGSFNFTVRATDASSGTSAPFTVSGAYNVTINAPTITVTPASVPSATATQAYSQTLSASGGTPGYTWDLMAGTLPAGVTLSTGGVLSGTPVETGTFNFTAMALDSSSGTQYGGAQAYTLVVAAPTVTVSPSSLPNPTAGGAYSQPLSASGAAGPYTFQVTAGTLPAGLTLSGGLLSGTPTETGVFNFTVTATDSTAGAGFSGSQAYSLTVGSPNFDLQPATLPHGQQGESYSQTVVASGGTAPYTYSAGPGLPPGVSLSSSGVLSGTPTQSGTFTFIVIARDSTTGPGAPFQVGRGYTWTVDVANPPTAAGASAAIPYASSGTAIDLTDKVGGVASSIAIGTAPAHGTVSVSGYVVTYTPAAGYFGDDGFTYTATGPGGTSAPATVSLTVAVPPAPTTAAASAAVPFNSTGQAIDLTASVTGVYSSIAVAQAPAHGTTSVSGTVVTYTPNTDHYGADSFTFTATGPGGTSAPATVSLTVDNPPPPVPAPQSGPAQVVAGGEVGVTVTNTGGLATGVTITTPPAHGTVTVESLASAAAVHTSAASGFALNYVPNPGYSGADSFSYALVGPGGTSQPQQVQVTVLPSVTLQPIEVSTLQGVPVQVDVTAGASGGPYTGAAVVSVGPSSAGTASFAQVGASRVMTFTPSDDFTGVAVVTYTVSNANSTSAPSTVTITVDARPNPALDADVRGLISAQVQAAQRFVDTQVQNFSQRNEQLHGASDQEGPRKHSLGLTFGFGDYAGGRPEDPASEIRRREMPERPFADQARRLDEMALAAADADAAPGGLGPIGGGKVALWSAGSIDFGQRHADAGGSKLKFTTSGVSLGADVEIADGLFVGVGAGYGYDATDIGSEGTRNASRSYMGAIYGSWRIAPQLYLDGVAGLGELSFDSRRVAPNDAMVIGRRDGSQAFGSISLAFDHHEGPMTVSSYGRLTVSKAELDAFTETGDPIFALAYDAQDVDASFGTLGVRGQWLHAFEDGSFTPRLRAEWRRQLSGADAALVRYADFLTGPSYQVDPLAQSQNTLLLGVGGDWRWDEGVNLSLDYEGQVGDEALSHRVTLKVSTRF